MNKLYYRRANGTVAEHSFHTVSFALDCLTNPEPNVIYYRVQYQGWFCTPEAFLNKYINTI